MKNIFTLLLLISLTISNIIAQDIGFAINLQHDGVEEEIFFKALCDKIEKIGNPNFVLYDWSDSKLKLIELEKFKEKPVELSIFTIPVIKFDDPKSPAVITTVDTNGIINSASFRLNYDVSYILKVVNVKTGVVEDIEVVTLFKDKKSNFGPKYSLEINHKKYFGKKRKSSISSKQFQAIKKRLYKDYRASIDERFTDNRNQFIGELRNVVYTLNQAVDMNVYKVNIPDKNTDKIKKVTIDGGSANRIFEGELLYIHAIVSIGDKKFSEVVSFVAADKVSPNKTICKKTFFQKKKKFTKIMKMYDQLYSVRNESAAKKILPMNPDDIVNLSMDLKKDNERWFFENYITKQPMINVIERKLDPELNQLRYIYKDERFIDYKLGAIQDQRLGAQYLLTYEDKNVNITNIATGKMVSVDSKQGAMNWYLPGYSVIQSLNMALLKVSGKSIEILKVLKEKKNKVKIIQVYNPLGFKQGDALDISIIKSEEVNGKTYERKEFIAKGYVRSDSTLPSVGELRITKKGQKALYTAIKNQDKLAFIYSIKRK